MDTNGHHMHNHAQSVNGNFIGSSFDLSMNATITAYQSYDHSYRCYGFRTFVITLGLVWGQLGSLWDSWTAGLIGQLHRGTDWTAGQLDRGTDWTAGPRD